MLPIILLVCCSTVAIFEQSAANPWDELRRELYTHHFTNGQVYEHHASLDRPPWSTWSRFYNDVAFHSRVCTRLDAFLALPKEQVKSQLAIRRAILLRDLWPAFDAQFAGKADILDQEAHAENQARQDRIRTLRDKLTKVMQRLELSDAEASQLADNFRDAVASNQFANRFDPSSPEKGFLPADLFDEAGPWVAIARSSKTPGGLGHLESVLYRSIFVPYLRVSDNRQDTLDYLTAYRDGRKYVPPPKGSLLALVRLMAVPTGSGRIAATSVMESLQLIVVDPPRDHHFKFVIDRAAIIAGGHGLRQLSTEDPIDAYSFEATGLFTRELNYDSDGELLVLGRHAGPVPKGITSLGHCAACHGVTARPDLFANFGESRGARAMSFSDQARLIISQKEKSVEWKAYQAAREQ